MKKLCAGLLAALSTLFIAVQVFGQGTFPGFPTATPNAIARFKIGPTGAVPSNSGVIIDDSNNITGPASITLSGGAVTGSGVTGLANPLAASDAASKAYVDAIATGVRNIGPSRLATAAVLPNTPTYANGASGVGATLTAGSNTTLTVDGTVAALADQILVKTQASAFQNGKYYVSAVGSGGAPWVLTRCDAANCGIEFDSSATMLATSYSFITAGATLINTSYNLQTTVATVGTSAVNFVLFSGATAGVSSLGSQTGALTCGSALDCTTTTINVKALGITDAMLAGITSPAKGGTGAGALTLGSVPYIGAAGVYTQDNANLFWDATNKRLSITKLAVSSTANQVFELMRADQENPNHLTFGTSAVPYVMPPTGSAVSSRIDAYYNGISTCSGCTTTPFWSEGHFNTGTAGSLAAGVFRGFLDTGFTSTGVGVIGVLSTGVSSVGGYVYGTSVNAKTDTVAAHSVIGLEVDVENLVNGTLFRRGIVVVSPGESTGTITGSLTINGSANTITPNSAYVATANEGAGAFTWTQILETIQESGTTVSPVRSTGSLWRAGGFTVNAGLDWRDMTGMTNGALVVPNATWAISAVPVAGGTPINLIRLDSGNQIQLGTMVTISPTSGNMITDGTLRAQTLTSTGNLFILGAGSDATHTDNTLCLDSSNGLVYKGSGANGVCLGTSSARYKERIADLTGAINEIGALLPKSFFYKPGYGDDGARRQYGFLAEDVVHVWPDLVGLDADGKPNTVDLLGMVPKLVLGIQELRAEVSRLRDQRLSGGP